MELHEGVTDAPWWPASPRASALRGPRNAAKPSFFFGGAEVFRDLPYTSLKKSTSSYIPRDLNQITICFLRHSRVLEAPRNKVGETCSNLTRKRVVSYHTFPQPILLRKRVSASSYVPLCTPFDLITGVAKRYRSFKIKRT